MRGTTARRNAPSPPDNPPPTHTHTSLCRREVREPCGQEPLYTASFSLQSPGLPETHLLPWTLGLEGGDVGGVDAPSPRATQMRFSGGWRQTLPQFHTLVPAQPEGGATSTKGPGPVGPWLPPEHSYLLGPSPVPGWVRCPPPHRLCAPPFLLQTPSPPVHEGKGHAWTMDSEIVQILTLLLSSWVALGK